MSLVKNLARKMTFAHLSSLGASSGRAQVDDSDDDDKSKKGRRAEGDDPDERDPDDEKGKKGRRAEEDDPDERDPDDEKGKKGRRAEEDDPDERDPDDEKGKKGRRAEDDDTDPDAEDDEDEMHGKSAVARSRRRERARCAAIFGSKAAARNPALAANLAFNTAMTRSQALGVLRDSPAAHDPNAGRSASNPNIGNGGSQSPGRKAVSSSSWDRAFAKANPGSRR